MSGQSLVVALILKYHKEEFKLTLHSEKNHKSDTNKTISSGGKQLCNLPRKILTSAASW
jgi:hypothetical protein